MALQITQVTITPNCRLKTDKVALEEALAIIRDKILFAMSAAANDNATFQIIATVERDEIKKQ